MTSAQTGPPRFPNPPEEYSQSFMQDLVRALHQFSNVVMNPGEGRNTFLVLTNLQSDDLGLEPGTLYKDGGFVKISMLNSAAVRSASLSTFTGTVTVTIT